jgi:hypothetical protein
MATTKAFELGDLGTELAVNADGTITALDVDTDVVSEGSTNLYFTNARARGAISVSGNLTYDSGTGVLGFTMPTTISSLSNHDTDGLSEGTGNLYFTTARARASISGGTGITYSSSTGQVELTASGVTAGSYGSASAVPVVTVDTYGRITGVTTTAVAGVSSVSYDSNSEVLTINTSDGGTPSVDLSIGGSLNGPLDEITVKYLASAPSTPIQGQFYFDSLNQKMKVYTGSAWVDAVPSSVGGGGGDLTDAVATMEKFQYTTSSVTNAVSGSDDNGNTLSYVVDGSQNIEVFVNGIKQFEGASNDYVATTGSSVAFTYNLPSGSVVDIQVYELLSQDAFYLKTETYTQSEVNTQISTAVGAYVPLAGGTMTGDLTTTGLTVDTNTLHVDSTNNRVGIGTTSPGTKFQIGDGVEASNRLRFFVPNLVSLGGGIQFYVASTEYFNIDYNSDTNKLLFNTDTTFGSNIHLMSLDRQNRRVGIGTDSPVALLDVSDPTSNEPQIRLTTATATNYLSIARDSSTGHYEFKSEETGSAISFHTDPDGTGSQNRLHIDRYGQTVIGEYDVANGYTPYGQLTVRKNVNNGTAVATNVSDLNDATLIIHNQDSPGTGNKAALVFAHAGSPGVPSAIVSTKQNGNWRTHLSFYTNNITGGASTGVMQEQMRIDHDGNVGIGTSSPDDNLHIASSSTWSGLKIVNNVSNGAGSTITLNSTGDLNRTAYIRMDSRTGEDALKLETNASNLQLFTNNAARIYVNSVGRVGVGVSNPLYPVTVAHGNPNNGIVQQLRNTTSGGNGAFLHFDINNVGDYSIGMPSGDNSFVIGKDLGNTGDQLVKYNADGSVLNNYGSSYPSRELTFNWVKSVSTSYVDLVTVDVPNAHYGYFYEIITTGGDWSNHSSARSYHKGMVNGYSGYGGHTKIESSGPYGSNIAINCVFVDGNGETKLQIKLDSGSVNLEVYVRLIGRVSNHTIHR